MMREDELLYKINVIIKYLKEHNGYNYKLYNSYVQIIMLNLIQI